MNVLTGFPLKKVRLYFFYSNFQGDNLSRYGLQNNAVIVIDTTSREISTFYIMRSTYSILADVLLFRSENIQRSNTATEKWICFWSNWCFIENTCSANSSKNNQNLWKTNDTTDIKESTSKFWNWWCFNILKYFFYKTNYKAYYLFRRKKYFF